VKSLLRTSWVNLTVVGQLCWGYVQSAGAAWITDDFGFLANQNVSDDKMADDWIVLV